MPSTEPRTSARASPEQCVWHRSVRAHAGAISKEDTVV